MVRALHDNDDPTVGPTGPFTPGQASQMLPLIRHIVRDLLQLQRAVTAQRDQLRGLDQVCEPMDQTAYREELSDIRGSLAEDEQRLQDCIRELTEIGVEIHQPFDGSVDFPALMNRRLVRLCWKPTDERVEYWHEVGQAPAQRRKLDAQALAAISQR